MDELPIMLATVLEVINDDDIDVDLLDEYAHPNRIAEFVVNQQLRFGPSPYVAIRQYIQHTVWRYPDDLFKQHFTGCLEMLIMYNNLIAFKHY